MLKRQSLPFKQPFLWLPGPAPDGHRHTATARAFDDPERPNRLIFGLRRRDEPVARLVNCPAQNTATRTLLSELTAILNRLGLTAWAPGRTQGVHRVIVQANTADRVAVLELVGPGAQPPIAPETLAQAMPPQTAVFLRCLSPHRVGQRARVSHLCGPKHGLVTLGEHRFRVTPPAWRPHVPDSVPALTQLVSEWLQPTPTDHLIEVGCGIGTLARILAPQVAHYLGIDVERQAILDAQINLADVPQAYLRTGDGTHALRRLVAQQKRADLMVLHGMRRPFGPALFAMVRALSPRRLIYIAPNVRALVSDLATAAPFEVQRLAGLDQLPGTRHLLTIAMLTAR